MVNTRNRTRTEWYILTVIAITGAVTMMRFVALEKSPPGFYSDEAAISAQVVCLEQSGHDNDGVKRPLFSSVLGDGYATPAMLYGGAAWVAVFGYSIASLRSFIAFHGALTAAGVFFLALALWGRRDMAWFAALGAAIAPWGFLFSRIAWDPALALCYLTWGLAFILTEGRWQKTRAVLGGLLLSLACYSYPATRVQAALILPVGVVVCFRTRPRLRVACALATAAFLISVLPLVRLTFSTGFERRAADVSITNAAYLRSMGGSTDGYALPLMAKIFMQNFALNFSPKYLFFTGDANLRHSTQRAGEWSWLDVFALLSAAVLAVCAKLIKNRQEAVTLALVAWGYLAGVVPAALTHESNPHALRSIGAWIFLALAAGFFLGRAVETWPIVRGAVPLVAIAFSFWYLPDFFLNYPQRAEGWFSVNVVEEARAARNLADLENAVDRVNPTFPTLGLRYFELSSGFDRCQKNQRLP